MLLATHTGAQTPTSQTPTTPGGSVDLYRVPEMSKSVLERVPKNVARWHMGATLVLTKDNQFQRIQVPDVGYFEESVFLSDNSALTYTIEAGTHNYIVDLGQFMRISRFFLNNQTAAGKMQLLACDTLEDVDSRAWIPLTGEVEFEPKMIPEAEFPEVETRYIMVRLNIAKSGTIGNFGAMGPIMITEAEFSLGKGESEEELVQAQSPVIDYDFSSAYTGTRIAYISGGPIDQILNLIDEDPTTQYAFPAGEECVIIVDMRKGTQVRTFAAQYMTKASGLVQVYFVDNLPNYFENAENSTSIATHTDPEGMIQRAQLAQAGSASMAHLARSPQTEIVRVPLDYFLEIEDSYSVRVDANEDRAVQIFDDLERRYAIFKFVPENLGPEATIQNAVYRPSHPRFETRQAQSGSGIIFKQIEIIGDVEFDDIIFTMEAEEGEPGGSPEDPPDDPPVISE